MKVLIIESSYPKDFFSEQLDGHIARHLTKLLGIDSELVYALDTRHLKKAIARAAKGRYDVLHISCHGRENGIILTDKTDIEWLEFVGMFTANRYCPNALVMSSCWGATDGVADEFEKVAFRPNIIFGSTDERYYNEYAVAWTVLYNYFHTEGVDRQVARKALRAISAIAHKNFRYLRWHDQKEEYVQYPGEGRRYDVVERVKKKSP
jgi:hypothetical protein